MKVFITIMVAIMIIGGVIFAVGMSKLDWDFYRLDFEEIGEEKTFSLSDYEGIESIEIDMEVSRVKVVRGDILSINYWESDSVTYTSDTQNGTFKFVENCKDQDTWDFIKKGKFGINGLKRSRLISTLTVPNSFEGELKVSADVGEVNIIAGGIFSKITATSSTGHIEIENVTTPILTVTVSTGSVDINKVTAATLTVDASTGSVDISNAVSSKITASTSTGSVDISNSAADEITASTSTGSVDLVSVTANKIRCTASTGSVEVSVKGVKSEYSITTIGSRKNEDTAGTDPNKSLYLKSNTGSVSYKFI